MLRSVYDFNTAHLARATTNLQRLHDDPEVLESSRRRFDHDDPPPAYPSHSTTEAPSPVVPSRYTEHQKEEIVCRPLTYEELYWFRSSFSGYKPKNRFNVESSQEYQRIHELYIQRDCQGRRLYRGPDLTGTPGSRRLDVMIRNSIKKRWQKMGIWNPEWGIPGDVRDSPRNNIQTWGWRWKPSHKCGTYRKQPWQVQKTSWPSPAEETADERAIRQFYEKRGFWKQASSYPGTIGEDRSEETLITSRPWYHWALEVEEEARRLRRLLGFGDGEHDLAKQNAKSRWKARGDWKDSWEDVPGWKWKHESPSPEPEDPNNMEFTPSEIDMLHSIPPPSPPDHVFRFTNPPSEAANRIFGDLLKKSNGKCAPAEDDPAKNDAKNTRRKSQKQFQFPKTEYGLGMPKSPEKTRKPTRERSVKESPRQETEHVEQERGPRAGLPARRTSRRTMPQPRGQGLPPNNRTNLGSTRKRKQIGEDATLTDGIIPSADVRSHRETRPRKRPRAAGTHRSRQEMDQDGPVGHMNELKMTSVGSAAVPSRRRPSRKKDYSITNPKAAEITGIVQEHHRENKTRSKARKDSDRGTGPRRSKRIAEMNARRG